jgi:DNA repair protein RadC
MLPGFEPPTTTKAAKKAAAVAYLHTHRWIMVRERSDDLSAVVRMPVDVAKIVLEHIGKEHVEHFHVYHLNTRNRVTSYEKISIGSLNGSLVHPREVFRQAIIEGAAGIVIGHNHPSGDPSPSREDVELTHRLTKAGEILGIALVDHIIVTPNGTWISMKEKGLLS